MWILLLATSNKHLYNVRIIIAKFIICNKKKMMFYDSKVQLYVCDLKVSGINLLKVADQIANYFEFL